MNFMGNRVKNIHAMTYDGQRPVLDYMKAKAFREERLFTYKNGQLFTEHEGNELTLQDFHRLFPLPMPMYLCRDNPDKTRII